MGIKGILFFLILAVMIIIGCWPYLEYLYYDLLMHFGFINDPLDEEKENEDE